jgi:hypothetical protein
MMKHTVTVTLNEHDHQFLSLIAETSLHTNPGMVRYLIHLLEDVFRRGYAEDDFYGVIMGHSQHIRTFTKVQDGMDRITSAGYTFGSAPRTNDHMDGNILAFPGNVQEVSR